MKDWVKHGPYEIKYEEECLCQNNSKGVQCDSCVTGFFNLKGECVRFVLSSYLCVYDGTKNIYRCYVVYIVIIIPNSNQVKVLFDRVSTIILLL